MFSVGEHLGSGCFVGLERHGDAASGVGGFGNVGPQAARISEGNIVLPAAPDLGVAPAHQEPVARVHVVVVRRAIDAAQGQHVTPVHHIEEQFVVALLRVQGLQHPEVGRKLHQPGRVSGRQLQVGYQAVCGVCRVDGEIDRAVQLFVCAGIAEGHSLGVGASFFDFDGRNCHLTPPF